MTAYLHIELATQQLHLIDNHQVLFHSLISSGLNGAGEKKGSGCTPRGWHVIKAKIGRDCPLNSVFIGRRFTGEIYTPELAAQYPQRDWILTRILWLGGLQPGYNRYGEVDTLRRYIYLHGTPDSEPMGIARSHGCIRLHNTPLIALFAQVSIGTRVWIE
ncbi:L,D-transpeptidase [Thioflexithrix psekupsensis]|uniref:L,D-transpeptidase n=1 Tax=Thioflexithrix psekupsensis TaxID=1570016 RepID=A0A251X4N0_9GAMM|nr:L,D-transpeptidase [Thioflexithrix psekupsensis]OUD12381.1 L,D-transpeptidase [Thioflexithrix psekupsensis]